MNARQCSTTVGRVALWCGLMAVACATFPRTVEAHDEHDNLPSTGVAVRGDRLILSPEAEKSLGISTTVVHLKNLEHDIMANATVEVPWRRHAFATSLVAGRIARVLVQPGDAVSQGQTLAEVESQEIEDLQLGLLKAARELGLADRLLEERSSLAASGSLSERRVFESVTTRDEFAAERGIAIRKLLSLGLTPAMIDDVLTNSKPVRTVPITSPISGTVSAAKVFSGQVVDPWQQVYEIVDLSTVWVHGQVLESESMAVREGQPVEIHVDALPEKAFVGIVDHVGVKLDPELRSLHVHVEVDNREGLLREGMFGRLRIRATVVADAVACPIDVVVDPGGQPFVLTQERPGIYIRQPVTLGMRSGENVEIVDGLFPGDPVVTTGKHELASLFAAEAEHASTQEALGGKAQPSRVSHPAARSASDIRPVVAQAQVELPTDKKAKAFSTVAGRIARVLVEHGEPVRAGQVLAEVESLELRNVQLDLLQAVARLKLARKLLDRYTRLGQSGGVAQKDLWQAQTDAENFQVTVDSMKNKLALMGLSQEEINRISQLDVADSAATVAIRTTTEIRAPIDGRITIFDLSIGQVVRPQDELFEVHDTSRILVRGYVHERDSAEVHVGLPVTVRLTADPAFSATGVISRTAPTLSTWGRAMSVWVELENPSGALKEGMLARLAIENPKTTRTAENR